MNHKFFLFFLLLLPIVFGYEIIGNTIIYENEFARLEVFPHTDLNFQLNNSVNPSFEQTFKITNKTNQERNLFFAFVFNKPLLSAQAFNLEPVTKTRNSFGWVSKSFYCVHDFNYSLNVFLNSINPHSLNCFDVNAEGLTYIKKDFPFYSGNPATKTALFYLWDINGTESYTAFEYINRSSFFNSYFSAFKNKVYYYTKTPLVFDAKGSHQFKIFYKPDPTDSSNKWDLIAWSGNKWDCILFDSCDAVYLLDPNWLKVEASSRYPINISMRATGSDTNTTFKLNADITDFGLTVSSDINRLLIFDQNKNIEIARVIDFNRITGDLNIFFRPLIPLAPNKDYNGTDYNGLKIYVIDTNYSDQNESWPLTFWWGSNFEIVADQGTWIDEGGNGTWTYPSVTQLNGTTGIVKKVQWGSSRETIALNLFQFPLSADYNIFVSFDSLTTAYDGITMFKALGQLGNTCPNATCHRIENVAGASNFRLYSDITSATFGSSSSGTWHYLEWDLNNSKNTGKEASGTATISNSSAVANYFGLDLDAINSAHYVYWDNIRIYKKLLIAPILTLGSEETQALSPDVNLNYPNGAEIFYKTSTYDINFSIQDGDSNSFLVDINIFQDSNNFVLLNDVNTDSATISCEDSDFSDSTICLYSWTIPEGIVSGDWNLTVFVSDGTNTAQDSTDANFTITAIPAPSVSPETKERYWAQEDSRFIDSNRFISPEDLRIQDSNRFFLQDDSRQESDLFSNKVFFKENQNIIILVIIIILIGIGAFLWFKKK